MKKILNVLILGISIVAGQNSVTATNTNKLDLAIISKSFMEPFPAPFDDMLKTNLIQGVIPAAVYAVNQKGVMYAGVGTCFPCDTNHGFAITLPGHLFPKGTSRLYPIRIARPGNTNVNGFIEEIISNSGDLNGLDLVQAKIGLQPKVIKGFFDRSEVVNASFSPSNSVTFGGRQVHTICSYITGKECQILGTGKLNGDAKTNVCTVIRFNCGPGYSGSEFYDEYGRIYFLDAGVDSLEVPGVTYLIGPIEFEHVKM